MIVRIEIENFRSIVRGRAVITEGINFIHGPNGVGKTSILEAIAFALYGTDWIRGRYKLSDLLRKGASTAIIRLEYIGIDGRRYLVQRAFTADKTIETQTYVIDEKGRRLAVRDREVTQFVIKTTGIDADTFGELLYIRQGEIREILKTGRRGERKLDEILRLDAIERTRQEVIRECLKNAQALAERVRGRLEALTKDYNARRLELNEISKNLELLEAELRKSEEELERIEGELKELLARTNSERLVEAEYEALKSKLESIKKAEAEVEDEVRRIREELVQLGELKRKIVELEAIVREEGEFQMQLEELRKERDLLREKIAVINEAFNRAKTLRRELEDIERRMADVEAVLSRIEHAKSRLSTLRRVISKKGILEMKFEALKEEATRTMAEIEHLGLELQMLDSSVDKCPVCGRPLTESLRKALIEERTRRLHELKDRLGKVQGEIEAVRRELESLRELEEEALRLELEASREDEARLTLEELKRRKAEIEEEIKRIEAFERNEIERRLAEVERRVREVEARLKEIESLKLQLAELKGVLSKEEVLRRRLEELEEKALMLKAERTLIEEELKKLEARIEGLKALERRISELEARKNALMRRIGELRGRYDALKARSEAIKKELEAKGREIEELRELAKRYASAIDVLTKLHRALEDAKPIIRGLFLASVNEELNFVLKDVLSKQAFTSIEINEDYQVIIRRRDGVVLTVDSLSIGEKNLISLLLRYAIARVVMGVIPLLILDEPTEHLDDEHRRRIAYWIRGLSNGVKTIIITSHVDALETIADNIIRVSFINDKGESTFYNS